MSAQGPASDFATRYPDPVVHARTAAPLDGVDIIEVYDRSQATEDPIGTSLWFDLPEGDKLPFDARGLSAVLGRRNVTATSSAAAYEIATLLAEHGPPGGSATLVHRSGGLDDAVPKGVRAKLEPPRVEGRAPRWRVRFDVVLRFPPPPGMAPSMAVERWTVSLDDKAVEVRKQTLYSAELE